MAAPGLVGFVYNARLGEARALAERLAGTVGEGEAWVASSLEVERFRPACSKSRLVITLGGDGTILRAVRVAAPAGVPIVGVNMGRVGFMTELRAEEAMDRIGLYLEGRGWVEERTMLEALVHPEASEASAGEGPPPFIGLNDAVVGRGSVSRLVFVEAKVDGVPLTVYAGDAVVVATATGSTGYALAAGGPILHPQSAHLILKPVAAHLSLPTALVLPPESVVDLTVQMEHQAMLSVDGFVDLALAPGDRVRVQRSRLVARFLRSAPPSTFYSTLLQRLGLAGKSGGPPRAVEGP